MNNVKETLQDPQPQSPPPSGYQAPATTFSPQDYSAGVRGEINRAFFPEDPRRKSTVIAMFLSLMPGLGQVYIGYYQQGFINIITVSSLIAILNNELPNYLYPLLGVFLAFFWLYNIVDAGRRASYNNMALAGLVPADLPPGFKVYSGQGSLLGGAALMLAGGITLAHTRFGMPLAWLEQWWPVGLVLAGGYLLFLAWQDRNKK
jgi:hypothetical protein